ncbi:ATP-binding cassette domain-containing protein [Agrobacterium sp. a22-2]|uniref:ABC transporter ATP-binding protein n=1 Tax=Agrobacterium sp. a22-2 TaxID=2283840 RepID=UPI00144562AF|nr:oligopeptide/dipeptide ABC transporter ATP-binding protein [Agrobacterium sp. a22-2]NKN36374.1 ATP-binding cassette domain-containing protein [Agrobacterium sp. a22-2]
MTQPPLIDIRSLTRDYASHSLFAAPHSTRALDELSLTVEAGTIFGIVGESGCGKSTLARLVMALDRPTAGHVIFDGDDLFSLSPRDLIAKRAHFQMVFQDPFGSLDPRQTVGRIIAEPLHVLPKKLSKAETREKVADMLESVGLTAAHAERHPHEFSGGQRQRIAIARALITEPKLVVADEAVSALDLSVQAQVLNLLMDLREKRGVTFLFITHNLAVVDCIADRVGVMYRGRLVETGPAHDVFEAPLHPYTHVLADAEPSIERFGRPAGQPRPAATLNFLTDSGCAFRARCPLAVERCALERPELRTIVAGRQAACHRAEQQWALSKTEPTSAPAG